MPTVSKRLVCLPEPFTAATAFKHVWISGYIWTLPLQDSSHCPGSGSSGGSVQLHPKVCEKNHPWTCWISTAAVWHWVNSPVCYWYHYMWTGHAFIKAITFQPSWRCLNRYRTAYTSVVAVAFRCIQMCSNASRQFQCIPSIFFKSTLGVDRIELGRMSKTKITRINQKRMNDVKNEKLSF